jgi:hypothetical protein
MNPHVNLCHKSIFGLYCRKCYFSSSYVVVIIKKIQMCVLEFKELHISCYKSVLYTLNWAVSITVESLEFLAETYESKLNDAENLWRSCLPFCGYWGIKWEQREACHCLQSSFKLKKEWSFSPLYVRCNLGSGVIWTLACVDDTL